MQKLCLRFVLSGPLAREENSAPASFRMVQCMSCSALRCLNTGTAPMLLCWYFFTVEYQVPIHETYETLAVAQTIEDPQCLLCSEGLWKSQPEDQILSGESFPVANLRQQSCSCRMLAPCSPTLDKNWGHFSQPSSSSGWGRGLCP